MAGSTAEEGWWGISNGKELAALFSRYPQVIFFNGHSHWVLSSYNEMFAGDGTRTFTAFNTSSVGYLWTGYNIVPGEYLYGSEGLFVEVAEHTVTVRGRDFVNGEWTASAQYAVPGDWNAVGEDAPEAEENDETAETETETVPTAPSPSAENGPAETGCSSAVSAGAVLPAVCAAAFAARRKKKARPGNRPAFL